MLFCPMPEQKAPMPKLFCSAAEAPDSAHEAFCPLHAVANGNVDAFLLDVGAKKLWRWS